MLKPGDIIEIKNGHTVYFSLPLHCIYANKEGVFNETAETDVIVGSTPRGLDTDFLEGRYVVISANLRDSGGRQGVYVECQKLPQGDESLPPLKIAFFESGGFTAEINELKPVGRAKSIWVEEDL